jgi:hypothetical protein
MTLCASVAARLPGMMTGTVTTPSSCRTSRAALIAAVVSLSTPVSM